MKKPPTKVMVMGHPVVSTPMMLASGVGIAASLYANNLFGVLLIAPIAAAIGNAAKQASAYRAWARQWQGMAGDSPRPRKRMPRWLPMAVAGLAWLGLLLLGGATAGVAVQGAVLFAGIVVTVAVTRAAIRWTRRWRRPGRVSGTPTVAIVARPVMPVPSLADAYRALPPHCQTLLRGQP